jgi:hypothetical protein
LNIVPQDNLRGHYRFDFGSDGRTHHFAARITTEGDPGNGRSVSLQHVGDRGLRVRWIAMMHDDGLPGRSDQGQTGSATRPSGTLVIRTWNEPDQAPGFRARLTYSQNPEHEPSTASTADPDEVLNIVRQWLTTQTGSPHET